MLAFQSKEFVENIARSMEKFTPMTVGGPNDLLGELDQVRRDGFAINRGERMAGVCGVAAPVTNKVRGT